MSGLNKFQVIGNLGKDPEVRTLESGAKVANFSVATSETWKDKNSGEKKEQTEWHNVVIWGPLAGVVESYVNKGDKLYLEGKIKTRSWEKDGVTRYTTELYANNMIMLSSKPDQSHGNTAAQTTAQTDWKSAPGPTEEPDDLPF